MRWTGKVSPREPATGTMPPAAAAMTWLMELLSVGEDGSNCLRPARPGSVTMMPCATLHSCYVRAPQHQALSRLRRRGALPDAGRRQPRSRHVHRLHDDPLRELSL